MIAHDRRTVASEEAASERRPGPFFVVGADRSGTTMLRLMLDTHPEIAIPPESHFLTPLVKALPTQRVLRPDEVKLALKIIIGDGRFSTWRTTPEALDARLADLITPTLARVVDATFGLEIAATGKAFWGDKTPAYAGLIPELAELFPSARFIHIVRDGRDVSSSLKRVAWSGWTEFERARYWARTVLGAESAGACLGPARYMLVRYEDLVLSTATTLRALCSFLGVEIDDRMLAFHERALESITDEERSAGIHNKLSRPPRNSDVARWRSESSWLRILLFEATAGRAMDELGIRRHVPRGLAAVTALVYSPVGGCVAMLHRVFDALPVSAQMRLGNSRFLRRTKAMVTRW